MKLYELAASPSAKRVNIFLKEIDVQIDSIHVDIRSGENLQADFLEKSVNGRIPLLELGDGSFIYESVAICRYLEATKKPEFSLFGDSVIEQARIEMWHRMVELQGLVPAFQAFRNISGVYSDRENTVPSWGEESRLRVSNFLPELDKQLSTHQYIAGDKFSIVDISAFVLINFCMNIDLDIPQKLTNLQKWFDLVSTRPSVQP